MRRIIVSALITVGMAISIGSLINRAIGPTEGESMSMVMSDFTLAPLHGDAYDQAFINQMTVHHTGAIAMARLVQNSTNPEIRRLADSIIVSQSAQNSDMQRWARRWGYEYHSPNQLTIAAMSSRMQGLTGDQLDKRFLFDMTSHHNTAVDMTSYSPTRARHSEIKKLSRQISRDQTAEISLMQTLLSQY
ncbi:MAG: DUF305 domain-containing protein [Candidatus Saccharimonadales bacterium]